MLEWPLKLMTSSRLLTECTVNRMHHLAEHCVCFVLKILSHFGKAVKIGKMTIRLKDSNDGQDKAFQERQRFKMKESKEHAQRVR